MYILVDVEADGPVPGLYSMVSIGAVIVEDGLERTFYRTLQPISTKWLPEALAVSGHTREECLTFEDPRKAMEAFDDWLKTEVTDKGQRPMFVSDNNGFDWQFVNYYFWNFSPYDRNPFGHSSTNLGSLYKGLVKDTKKNFKHLRKPIPHSHHPIQDAKGNALALLKMKKMGLKIDL